MTFRAEALPTFISEVFENSKKAIRAFDGCQHMELLQHCTQENVLFTLSYWDDEAALERYRDSALFADTWAKTKALFADKPQAWSTVVVDGMPPI